MRGDGGQCVEQEAVMSLDKSIAHGKERQKNRSKTFPGIAKAMAEQWG